MPRLPSYLQDMKVLVSLLAATIMATALSVPASANPLQSLEGKKRALLLFAKSRSDARLDKQVDLLRERRPGLSDRDLVVLVTAGNQDTALAIGYASLRRGTNRLLRETFKPQSSGLTVVLIGKDGLEKARWKTLVQPDEVFATIDSLPEKSGDVTN